MDAITLKIEGMTYIGSASSIEKALEGTDGVLSADVALNPSRANVDYNPDLTTPAALGNAVENAGFDVTV
jgi:copper chaperone